MPPLHLNHCRVPSGTIRYVRVWINNVIGLWFRNGALVWSFSRETQPPIHARIRKSLNILNDSRFRSVRGSEGGYAQRDERVKNK